MKLLQNITFFVLKTLSGIRKKVIGKHAKGVLCSTENGLLVVGADDLESWEDFSRLKGIMRITR